MNKPPNAEIRSLLSSYRLQYVEIASRLGITEKRFEWQMRKELPKNQRKRVLLAVGAIVKEEGL